MATLIIPNISFIGSKSQAVRPQENLQRLQELLVNRYIPDMGGNVYLPPTGDVNANPYAGTNVGNMAANLPAPAGTTALFNVVLNLISQSHPSAVAVPVCQSRHRDHRVDPRGDGPECPAMARPLWTTNGATYSVSSGTSASPSGTVSVDEYGVNGDPTVLDAWSRPIVIQVPPATTLDPTTGEPGVNLRGWSPPVPTASSIRRRM